MKPYDWLRKKIKTIVLESDSYSKEYELKPLSKEDAENAINLCDKIFKDSTFKCSQQNNKNRLLSLVDYNKSIKMIVNGKIVGVYLLSNKESMNDFMEFLKKEGSPVTIVDQKLFEQLSDKNGIQGLVVGLLKEFRQNGLGEILLQYPKSLGFDYVWGCQTHGVSDVSKWLKRRKLIATAPHYNITVEVF